MTRPDPTPVTVEPNAGPHSGHSETHPSFGCIQVSRCSGTVKLFGSPIPRHDHFIALRIHTARRDVWDAGESVSAKGGIIEVALSEAQWASLLSSLNIGQGTPCTITWQRGIGLIPEALRPPGGTALQRAINRVHRHVSSLPERLRVLTDRVRALTGKLPKKHQQDIDNALQGAEQIVGSDNAFFLGLVQEELEKIVAAGEAELAGKVDLYLREMAAVGAAASPETAQRFLGLPGPAGTKEDAP